MPASVIEGEVHPVSVGYALLQTVRAARCCVLIVIKADLAHGFNCETCGTGLRAWAYRTVKHDWRSN